MIHYIPAGDIFKVPGVHNYAHGCNCAGAMGKGIALQFKSKYPEMYNIYRHMCQSQVFRPGSIYDYDYGEGHVYNLGTEEHWKLGAKLEYIERSVEKMLLKAKLDGVGKIAMPAIGSGLGGLNWTEVKRILNSLTDKYPEVDLYVVETYRP